MNLVGRIIGGLVLVLACGGMAWVAVHLGPSKSGDAAAKPEPPAKVTKPAKEADLNTIVLTEEAEKHLALKTGKVARQKVDRARTFGGEVAACPGRTVVVSAPLAGTIKAPAKGVPVPGKTIDKGTPVFLLVPLLTAEARASLANTFLEADGLVNSAEEQLELAKKVLARAEKLFKEEAGTKKAVDDAQAQRNIAEKAVETAKARRDLLQRTIGEADKGDVKPIPLDAPEGGLIRNLHAHENETVPSGTALFELTNLDKVWVRVPVYVGDVAELAPDSTARIGSLAGRPGAPTRDAKRVEAPPTANPLASTVDLYFELDNKDRDLAPGQRVGVTLDLSNNSKEESLVVPWKSVVHDIHGNTWVYQKVGEHTFARRRILVRFIHRDPDSHKTPENRNDLAVLLSGPAPGTEIVTDGAAELFGTELGGGK
jgi:RND family efflux transporter MFP subunit